MERINPSKFYEKPTVINVKKFGAKGNGVLGTDAQAVIDAMNTIPAGGRAVIFFPAGSYIFEKEVAFDDLLHITFTGDKARIKKGAGFAQENLFKLRFAENVRFTGLHLEGLTTSEEDISWGDMGISCYSCDRVTIDHCRFYHCGDSAWRITTSASDSGVQSNDNVACYNYIYNCTQTSTTSSSAGCTRYIFHGNIAEKIKGSLKFASRAAGAGNFVITNNIIKTSLNHGLELSSVSNCIMANNILTDIAVTGISCYTNTDALDVDFAWKNHLIYNNLIVGCANGIRYNNTAYSNGVRHIFDGLFFHNNFVETASDAGIKVIGGRFRNLNVCGNAFKDIAGSKCIEMTIYAYNTDTYRENFILANNLFQNITGDCMVTTRASGANRDMVDVFIQGNKIDTCSRGVYLQDTTNGVVSGNMIVRAGSGAGNEGVYFQNCTNSYILGNYIDAIHQAVNVTSKTSGGCYYNILKSADSNSLRTDATSTGIFKAGGNVHEGNRTYNYAITADMDIGPFRIVSGSAAPSSGTWKLGDRCWNTAPAEAGTAGSKYVTLGWICTSAGTSGTWKEMRVLTGA